MLLVGLALALGVPSATRAASMFVEAESFQDADDGWRPSDDKSASALKTLSGAAGATNAVARSQIEVVTPGVYRLWVRYLETPFRGPFTARVSQGGREVAAKTFDLEPRPGVAPWQCEWSEIGNARLEAGFAEIEIEKYQGKNCSAYTRHVDCFLFTDDLAYRPSHYDFGPQTWLRVTLGDGYDTPVYVHVFADHYRDPWSGHHSITKAGMEDQVQPVRTNSLLRSGETTGWINISRMIYPDSGVCMVTSLRESYYKIAPRLRAKFEFATAPDENAVVRTIERDAQPGVISILVPPDLGKPENQKRLTTDLEMAEATGRQADAFRWPTFGRKPARFPFRVTVSLDGYWPRDRKVVDRENKTLDYFGFNNVARRVIPGEVWFTSNACYCLPDLPKMKSSAREAAEKFKAMGKKAGDIVYAQLTDEAGGQPLEHLAGCAACGEAFREWLRGEKLSPSELGVSDWAALKPVGQTNFPALYFYSQKFRTRALGEFQRVQREVLREAYGADFPAIANNSDGATYYANFYGQGVDYFELLDTTRQNALWGEDWANYAASPQCASYNVELMRSAAMKRGETLGTYLVCHAGRLPWDIRLNAVSMVARDIKFLESFGYGPAWSGHEGGPPWASSSWLAKTNRWFSMAELVREIGGAERLLYPAKKARSPVAILYSSSSDIWTLSRNRAYGFDRMFTWLALAHRQVPVDFVSEARVADGDLGAYRVAYLAGPNLARAAAEKLAGWVRKGGVLVMSAGAASRDEFNRPLDVLDPLLPAKREAICEIEPFVSSGGFLDTLRELDEVRADQGRTLLGVFSVKQVLKPKSGAQVLGSFSDGGAAWVAGAAKKGHVYLAGFLPGIAYMRPALVARKALAEDVRPDGRDIPDPSEVQSETALIRRSWCPWQYPAGIRELLVQPVDAARASLPVRCDVPLVDAVLMESKQGAVVPLANYTLQPLKKVTLTVKTPRKVERVESVHHGTLPFTRKSSAGVEFSLPLRESDFVLLRYGP